MSVQLFYVNFTLISKKVFIPNVKEIAVYIVKEGIKIQSL